jgi:hypothetical protein
MIHLIGDEVIEKNRAAWEICIKKLVYIVCLRAENPNHDMFEYLGVYFDMRYWRYHKRTKYLAGLSSYNDDEIVEQIEKEDLELTKRSRKEYEELHIEMEKVFEKYPVAQLVLEKYPNLNIRELAVCYEILSTTWDIGTVFYFELVPRTIGSFMKLFFGLKHIQDTIQGLIHKGIIIPMIGRNNENENSYIYLTLCRELEEQAYSIMSGNSKEVGI